MDYQELVSYRASIQTLDEKLERLTKAAEKVYQLRTEAPGGDRFVEFYNALLLLGHALNINKGYVPRDEDRNAPAEREI